MRLLPGLLLLLACETRSPAADARAWTARITDVRVSYSRPVTLKSVRVATHQGFDRIVFDFGEGSIPSYRMEYVDKPQHQCASGQEVWLKGDAWLEIRLQSVQAHDDAGMPTVTERDRRPGLPNLLELRLTCDFEGVVSWVAGVGRPNGYRVLLLREPNRIAVDIRH